MTDTKRAAFEAWALATEINITHCAHDSNEYAFPAARASWRAWQAASASAGKPVALPQPVLDALRFYAHGHHYVIDDDHQSFDTISGEPQNWMVSERDGDRTMLENGGIAWAVLRGIAAHLEDPPPPIEGEVFTAHPAPSAPAQPAVAQRSGVEHFNYLCSLLPEGFHWGDPLTPDVLNHIALAAAPAQDALASERAIPCALASAVGGVCPYAAPTAPAQSCGDAEQANEGMTESPKETMERLKRQFNQMSDMERDVMYDFLSRAKACK